jgi:hypothetical protein
MKVSLVDLLFQFQRPNLNQGGVISSKSKLLSAALSLEPKRGRYSNAWLIGNRLIDDLKLNIEGKLAEMSRRPAVRILCKNDIVVGEG